MNPHSLRCVESARGIILKGYAARPPMVFVYDEGNVLFVCSRRRRTGEEAARVLCR